MATLSRSHFTVDATEPDAIVLSETLCLQRDDILSCFNLGLSTEKASALWTDIVEHRDQLRHQQDREVDLRTAAFDLLLRSGLLEDPVVVEKQGHQQAEGLAYRDRLTGLYNYAYFDNELRLQVARATRYRTPLCLILVDLDHFKQMNDRYGHAAGNDLLSVTGRILGKGLREGDLVARLGGDEFAILLHEADLMTGIEIATGKRHALRQALREQFEHPPHVSMSIGVATVAPSMSTARGLFDAADRALYHAKHEGRNRCAFAHRDQLVCISDSSVGTPRPLNPDSRLASSSERSRQSA